MPLPRLNTQNLVPDFAGAHQNALRSQGQMMQNQLLGEQVKGIPQQQQMDATMLELKKTSLDIQRKALAEGDPGKPISIGYPEFTVKGPAGAVAEIAGVLGEDPNRINDPGFPAFMAEKGVSYEPIRQDAETTTPKWTAPKEGVDDKGNPIIYRVNNDGQVDILKGIKPKPAKGMKIYDRDGNLLVDTGGGEVTTKSKGKIEEKILSGKEQLARMQTITSSFKPEYLEIGTRLSASWTGLKAKLGQDVSKEDAAALTDFKKFQRKSIENINLYIKELTGAQMSEKEADRLRLAQPDPGENWWSGDDPITFKAKMDDVIKMTRAAVARWEYYRSKGLSESAIKTIINDNSAKSLDEIVSRM